MRGKRRVIVRVFMNRKGCRITRGVYYGKKRKTISRVLLTKTGTFKYEGHDTLRVETVRDAKEAMAAKLDAGGVMGGYAARQGSHAWLIADYNTMLKDVTYFGWDRK